MYKLRGHSDKPKTITVPSRVNCATSYNKKWEDGYKCSLTNSLNYPKKIIWIIEDTVLLTHKVYFWEQSIQIFVDFIAGW